MASPRIILITGGTNGIGLAIAKSFAKIGDQVVVWGRNDERITAVNGQDTIEARRVDVSQPKAVAVGVQQIVDAHGKIDVLVTAAGFTKPFLTTVPYDEAVQDWNALIATNLTGAFLPILAAAKHLTRPGGRIIAIGSAAAVTGSALPGGTGYAAAKAGVTGMALGLARELGPQGITVNVVAPGFIAETGITQHYPAKNIAMMVEQTPVGRAGTPEDIASAVVYLASAEAGFIHGQILHVNGGWIPGR